MSIEIKEQCCCGASFYINSNSCVTASQAHERFSNDHKVCRNKIKQDECNCTSEGPNTTAGCPIHGVKY